MRLDPAHFGDAVGNQAPVWPYSINRGSAQARGLFGWWPGQPANASKLFDLSGRANHGSFSGPGLRALKDGTVAPDFDGSTDEIDLGDIADFRFLDSEPWSVTCRAIFDDITTDDRTLISKSGATAATQQFLLYYRDPAASRMDVLAGASTIISGTASLYVVGRPYLFAVTHDGAGGVTFYSFDLETGAVIEDGLTGTHPGNVSDLTQPVLMGRHGSGSTDPMDGAIWDVRFHTVELTRAEIAAQVAPETRHDLFEEICVPRVWPKAGGAASRSGNASLQAALQHQVSLPAAIDAAVRAEAVLTALADVALERVVPRSVWLDGAVQAVVSAQAGLEAALTRWIEVGAGLDANLSTEGPSQRVAGIDGAIRRLNVLSGALEAALRASMQGSAALDAWLALNLVGTAGLDAAAMRGRQLSDTALQAVLRASPNRAAALDAVIGLVVAAAASRTQAIGARGRHAVAGGQRSVAIPSGNRRH